MSDKNRFTCSNAKCDNEYHYSPLCPNASMDSAKLGVTADSLKVSPFSNENKSIVKRMDSTEQSLRGVEKELESVFSKIEAYESFTPPPVMPFEEFQDRTKELKESIIQQRRKVKKTIGIEFESITGTRMDNGSLDVAVSAFYRTGEVPSDLSESQVDWGELHSQAKEFSAEMLKRQKANQAEYDGSDAARANNARELGAARIEAVNLSNRADKLRRELSVLEVVESQGLPHEGWSHLDESDAFSLEGGSSDPMAYLIDVENSEAIPVDEIGTGYVQEGSYPILQNHQMNVSWSLPRSGQESRYLLWGKSSTAGTPIRPIPRSKAFQGD